MRFRRLQSWFRDHLIVLRFSIIALVVSGLLLISAVVGAINFDCLIVLNLAIELFARR
jgi:tetrahydromethanopterin S-methyltransferase subunit E